MPAPPTPSEIARQWFEDIWVQRDHAAIHRLMAPDAAGYLEPDVAINGPDHFFQVFHGLTSTFPDFNVRIEDVTGDDRHACVRWAATGTHSDDALGMAATGRQVAFRASPG